ncbi:unnamed protein product, partial [Durusdinium trenchii]
RGDVDRLIEDCSGRNRLGGPSGSFLAQTLGAAQRKRLEGGRTCEKGLVGRSLLQQQDSPPRQSRQERVGQGKQGARTQRQPADCFRCATRGAPTAAVAGCPPGLSHQRALREGASVGGESPAERMLWGTMSLSAQLGVSSRDLFYPMEGLRTAGLLVGVVALHTGKEGKESSGAIAKDADAAEKTRTLRVSHSASPLALGAAVQAQVHGNHFVFSRFFDPDNVEQTQIEVLLQGSSSRLKNQILHALKINSSVGLLTRIDFRSCR